MLLSPTGLFLCLMLLGNPVGADQLYGRVVGVTDGDTVTLLDATKTQHKIRLAGLDAPERSMPWGQKAKQGLSELVHDRDVRVDWDKRDRYGRIVGKIRVNDQDAGLAMLSQGLAWHYKKYENEQSESDRTVYARLESEARAASRGLWSDPSPVPPWEWRKK